jgi:hypothetical protein
MIRADQERREALTAVANMGAGSATTRERFRTVVYLVGDLQEHDGDVSQYTAYVVARDWQVVAVRSDLDANRWAWMRKGLLSATTIICHGNADGIVIPESVFNAFSDDDRTFVLGRLHRYGGFLHTIPSEDGAQT